MINGCKWHSFRAAGICMRRHSCTTHLTLHIMQWNIILATSWLLSLLFTGTFRGLFVNQSWNFHFEILNNSCQFTTLVCYCQHMSTDSYTILLALAPHTARCFAKNGSWVIILSPKSHQNPTPWPHSGSVSLQLVSRGLVLLQQEDLLKLCMLQAV